MTRPRIVAFAYSCLPGAGSEPGAGWMWSRLLAGIGETVVICRPYPGRRELIEAALRGVPERGRLHFVFVDIPRLLRVRPMRRLPTYQRFEYAVWQMLALRTARRMHARAPFDLAWHLTYANAWTGSLASLIGPPFVYGPVGGGVSPPWRLVAALGAHGIAYEIMRSLAHLAGRTLSPLARVSWSRAQLILVQNEETRAWLPAIERKRAHVFPNVVLDPAPARRTAPPLSPPTAVFAGRLLPLKGTRFAVRALTRLPEWRLVVCGEGGERVALERLARALRVDDRVEFRGWVPRQELLRILRDEAHVFLFPSLHEEGCWATAEALASGVPVVALDRGGPALHATRTVRTSTPRETVARIASAVRSAAGETVCPPALDLVSLRARVTALLADAGLPA